MKAIVIKKFVFYTSDFYRTTFWEGDIIEYSRYRIPSDKMDGTFNHHIRIDRGNNTYFGEDFDIETYTEEFKGLEDYPVETVHENISKHVHIERCDGTCNANKFMSNIPREDIIDVKPMENNTYLVIYVKEDEE